MLRGPASRPVLALRLLATLFAVFLWFWTQSLFGSRQASAGISDVLHDATAGASAYFAEHSRAADALLIVSSGLIDLLGIFLIAEWILVGRSRAFLGLVLLLALRQAMQALCALPPPPNMIWHYPGFPSLLVTYSVGGDFFFSGHAAIAVFAATEIARLKRSWLTALAMLVVVFEVLTVLVLRAHYTMDVFTGLIAALLVAATADRIA